MKSNPGSGLIFLSATFLGLLIKTNNNLQSVQKCENGETNTAEEMLMIYLGGSGVEGSKLSTLQEIMLLQKCRLSLVRGWGPLRKLLVERE